MKVAKIKQINIFCTAQRRREMSLRQVKKEMREDEKYIVFSVSVSGFSYNLQPGSPMFNIWVITTNKRGKPKVRKVTDLIPFKTESGKGNRLKMTRWGDKTVHFTLILDDKTNNRVEKEISAIMAAEKSEINAYLE